MKVLILSFLATLSFCVIEHDRVTKPMPQCSLPKNMFSGYLKITEEKEYHYVYVESQGNPETDPLLFWFNGGPGCSSMIGFIQELGPCVFMEESDKIPQDNPYAWTKNASVVFLETPVGVGYNQFKGSFAYDDENVSYENLKAVQEFFLGFPELINKRIYLTGESYAGIYIPYLALRMVEFNEDSETPEHLKINLEGFLIGNGVTNYTYDKIPALVDMVYGMGIIDIDLHERFQATECNFAMFARVSDECKILLRELNGFMKNIYNYDIYRPLVESYNEYMVPMERMDSNFVSDFSEEEEGYPYLEAPKMGIKVV